jgi:hypothetical protein
MKLREGIHYTIPEGPGCWEWLYSCNKLHGYGQITVNQQKWRAHRYAWLQFRGDIPEGLQVLHLCNNVKCVNPNHLMLGSVADNARQASQDGLLCAGKERSELIRRNWTNGVYEASIEFNRQKALERYRALYGQKSSTL